MTVIDARGNLHSSTTGEFLNKPGEAAGFDLAAPAAATVQVVPRSLSVDYENEVTSYGDYVSAETRDWLAEHVDAGHIPLEALTDPDPRPHLDAVATRLGASFAQRADLYRQAGLTMRGSILDMRDRDQIVATPLVANHYKRACDECLEPVTQHPEHGLVHTNRPGPYDTPHDPVDSFYDDILEESRQNLTRFDEADVSMGDDGRTWVDIRTPLANFYAVPADQVIDFVPDMTERCHTCGELTRDDPAADFENTTTCGTCEVK